MMVEEANLSDTEKSVESDDNPIATWVRERMFIHSTSKSYNSHSRKFCNFFNVTFSEEQGVPRILLTDNNLCQYFKKLRTSNLSVSNVISCCIMMLFEKCSLSSHHHSILLKQR